MRIWTRQKANPLVAAVTQRGLYPRVYTGEIFRYYFEEDPVVLNTMHTSFSYRSKDLGIFALKSGDWFVEFGNRTNKKFENSGREDSIMRNSEVIEHLKETESVVQHFGTLMKFSKDVNRQTSRSRITQTKLEVKYIYLLKGKIASSLMDDKERKLSHLFDETKNYSKKPKLKAKLMRIEVTY